MTATTARQLTGERSITPSASIRDGVKGRAAFARLAKPLTPDRWRAPFPLLQPVFTTGWTCPPGEGILALSCTCR